MSYTGYGKTAADARYLILPSGTPSTGNGVVWTGTAWQYTGVGTAANLSAEVTRATGAEATLTSGLASANTAITNLLNLLPVGTTVTASRALTSADVGQQLDVNASGAVTITLPSLPARTFIPWMQTGAGVITFAGGSGVTAVSRWTLATSGQWAAGYLLWRSTTTVVVVGDLT